MSSLLKQDTFYSSYGDPGKIYPYPSILKVSVTVPTGKFVYTAVADTEVDLEIFHTEVFQGITTAVSMLESPVSSTVTNISSAGPHYTAHKHVQGTGSTSVVSNADNYSFNYGDFNYGSSEEVTFATTDSQAYFSGD
jgi:hypothetical protein